MVAIWYGIVSFMLIAYVVPLLTTLLYPSRVRNSPCTSQGCRPSSAVIQPSVLAMYGNGNASIRTQSNAVSDSRRPRHLWTAAYAMRTMNIVPSVIMRWKE